MSSTPLGAPERFELPNGLTLLVERLAHAPVVAMQAWVRAGGADETEAVLGVAHLHEHMLFKGTLRRGVGEIARQVESAGGEINAWTSFDETVYHLTMDRGEAALGVDILADALRESAFDAGELARESEVVVEEIRRAQDSPGRRLHQAVFSRLFDGHPYGRPVLGTEATVRGMTRDQILAFYRQYYRPDNVTLVVVGDVDVAKLKATVELRLGDWAPSPATPGGQAAALDRPARPVQAPPSAARVQVLAEDVRESRLAMAWMGPSLMSPEVAAFDVMSMVLGQGETSRLFGALQRERSWVHDVHAYAYTPRDHGLLWVGAGLKDARAEPVVEVILAELAALAAAPAADDELERARTAILSDAAFQRESMQGQARKRGFFEVTAGDWQKEGSYLDAVRALQPQDLQAAARAVLAAPPTVVVQLPAGDAAAAQDPQKLARLVDARPSATARRSPPRGAVAAASVPPRVRAPAAPRGAGGVQIVRQVLDCGATLLVAPEPGPVLALRAVALGGQRWESAENAGVSNLFAHMLGQATHQRDSRSLAEALAALGGGLGAFAGRNSVGLRGDFLAERAGAGCALFAEALATPAWHHDDLARERGQILEAIRAREDSPQALAMDLFAECVYGGHPFGQRFIGTAETLARVDGAALEAYWRRFLPAGRLVIAAVGDIDPAWAASFFDERLPRARGQSLAAPVWPAQPRVQARRLPLQKQQSQIIIGAPGIGLTHPDRFAAEVTTTLLSGQGGRLFTDLRDRQSLAYSVHSASVPGLDAGHLMVFIATHPDKVPQAIAGVRHHLEQLRRTRGSDEELGRARRYLVGSHAIGLQSSAARAMTMALDEAYGLGHAAHRAYPESIGRVDADAAQALAARLLAPEQLVEVVVGP